MCDQTAYSPISEASASPEKDYQPEKQQPEVLNVRQKLEHAIAQIIKSGERLSQSDIAALTKDHQSLHATTSPASQNTILAAQNQKLEVHQYISARNECHHVFPSPPISDRSETNTPIGTFPQHWTWQQQAWPQGPNLNFASFPPQHAPTQHGRNIWSATQYLGNIASPQYQNQENPVMPAQVYRNNYTNLPSCGYQNVEQHSYQLPLVQQQQIYKNEVYVQETTAAKKRRRTVFNSTQLLELERLFSNCKYLSRLDRIKASRKLNLEESKIKNWFQNRRVKHKKTNC